MGIVRTNGEIATRNLIGIISSVNCSATVVKKIKDRFVDISAEYPNVDGVVGLTHGSGCGMCGKSDGLHILKKTIQG